MYSEAIQPTKAVIPGLDIKVLLHQGNIITPGMVSLCRKLQLTRQCIHSVTVHSQVFAICKTWLLFWIWKLHVVAILNMEIACGCYFEYGNCMWLLFWIWKLHVAVILNMEIACGCYFEYGNCMRLLFWIWKLHAAVILYMEITCGCYFEYGNCMRLLFWIWKLHAAVILNMEIACGCYFECGNCKHILVIHVFWVS